MDRRELERAFALESMTFVSRVVALFSHPSPRFLASSPFPSSTRLRFFFFTVRRRRRAFFRIRSLAFASPVVVVVVVAWDRWTSHTVIHRQHPHPPRARASE